MICFVEGHGDVGLIARGQGPSRQQGAFIAVQNADGILPRDVTKQAGAGLFQHEGFHTVGNDFDIAKLLGGVCVNDADQGIRSMGFSTAINDIQVACCRIIGDGVGINGYFDFAKRLIRFAVIDSDSRGIALHDKEFLEVLSIQNGVGRLCIFDCVDACVRGGIQYIHLVILFVSEKKPVPVDVGRKMIEVAVLESR